MFQLLSTNWWITIRGCLTYVFSTPLSDIFFPRGSFPACLSIFLLVKDAKWKHTLTRLYSPVKREITSSVVIQLLIERVLIQWWPQRHAYTNALFQRVHQCFTFTSRFGAFIKRIPGTLCYNSQHPHTQTPCFTLSLSQPVCIFSASSCTSFLRAFSLLTPFIKWLSHLVDDLRRSITALYHHLYWWRFAWLYVFLMASLGEIEWKDIWNSGKARRFILQQAFVYSCHWHTESAGWLWRPLNAFPGIKTHYEVQR